MGRRCECFIPESPDTGQKSGAGGTANSIHFALVPILHVIAHAFGRNAANQRTHMTLHQAISLSPLARALSLAFAAGSLISSPALASEAESESRTSVIETISVVSSKISQPRSEMATSVTVLTEDDLAAFGQLSLADSLRSVAAVGVSNSGGLGKVTTLRIRGEEGYRTLVLIDGVELSDPSAPQVTPVFDDILTSQIERIEVLRGTQGLLYGADAGGVIRIATNSVKPGEHTGFSGGIQSQFGKFSTEQLGANLGYANETSSVYLSATQLDTDGFNSRTDDTSNEADGYENTTLHFKADATIATGLTASLVLRNVDSEVEFDGCFDSVTFATIHDCLSESDQQTARVALTYSDDVGSHQFGYSNTDVERDFFSNGVAGTQQQGEIEKLDYLANFNLGAHRLTAGFEHEKESTATDDRQQQSLFAEFQYQAMPGWHSTVGVRYDENDTFGAHTSVRLGSAYLINNVFNGTVKLKAAYGTGFRAPSLFEQGYNDGDFAFGEAAGLQLTEEQSEGFDVGAEWYQDDAFLAITYFDQEIEDEIIFDVALFQGYLQTPGTSQSSGFEVEGHFLATPSVKVWANYTYNDSETQTGEQRLRRPEQLANLGITYITNNDRLRLNANLHHERDAIDIGSTPLDNFTTVDVSVQYEVIDDLTLSAEIENLFDREYQQIIGFNSANRAAYAGVKWQF